MKNYRFLQTDYYQISMGFAYVVEGINKQRTGFEGFVRGIKSKVNPKEDFYIFDGADEVEKFIADIKKELKDPELPETIIELIKPKITAENSDEIIEKFRENWKNIDTDFEYSIVPNGTKVFPLVPVFQFSGDKMIGQMIETAVTNIYNGRTGLATIKYKMENEQIFITKDEFKYLNDLMENKEWAVKKYLGNLTEVAKEFREETDKILLEAAFRRCPSFETAFVASQIAIENEWDGTSNTSLRLAGTIGDSKIGGTMAHAFVMSFENENDAFKAWDRIFPGTTMLIDTYDVENAAKNIKSMAENGEITLPKEVRIDSDPINDYAFAVDKIFEGKMNIFVSGDMSIEKYIDFSDKNVPYDKSMAGTKYVYDDMIVEKLNAGFVYKIVQYEKEGKTFRPTKKSNGKGNYSGLKYVEYRPKEDKLVIDTKSDKFGFKDVGKTTNKTKIEFI